jgi:hypothetical protein
MMHPLIANSAMSRPTVSNVVYRISLLGVFALLPLLAADVALAQSAPGDTTIAGVVLDPDAKAVVGAAVLSRNELAGDVQTTTTDGRGHLTRSPGCHKVEQRSPRRRLPHRAIS